MKKIRKTIAWDRVGALFWLASELRKIRLFFEPEIPTHERMIDSLEQALHHAHQVGFDQFVTREIDRALADAKKIGFNNFAPELKQHYANRLRIAMNNVAGLAEQKEKNFKPGPRAGHPAPRITKKRK